MRTAQLTMVFDHGILDWKEVFLEEIAISKFKATCLAVLDRVRRTRQPILVTRFGKPIAEIMPPAIPPRQAEWLGSLRESGSIRGDIVKPAADSSDWEAEAS